MFCPKCKIEYEDWTKECADCGTSLIQREHDKTFRYQAKTENGESKEDTILAINQKEAINKLVNQGLYPVFCREEESKRMFKYRAKTNNGEIREGVILSIGQKEAIDEVFGQGLYVIECKEVNISNGDAVNTKVKTKVRAKDHDSYWAFTILGLMIPLIGFIVGIIYLTKNNSLDRKLGEHTIVMSTVGVIIGFVLITIHMFI